MPLSDEEARMLQQLEQSLAQEDPDFASTLRGSKARARNRKIAIVAGIGFAAGVGVMFTGAFLAMTAVGILGFLIMVVGAYFFVTAWRGGVSKDEVILPTRGQRGSRPTPGGSTSFVDKMEERWQRRRDSDEY